MMLNSTERLLLNYYELCLNKIQYVVKISQFAIFQIFTSKFALIVSFLLLFFKYNILINYVNSAPN